MCERLEIEFRSKFIRICGADFKGRYPFAFSRTIIKFITIDNEFLQKNYKKLEKLAKNLVVLELK